MHQRRVGFTLIELLIVLVVIGILATIAVPQFGNTRKRAYFKSMMSDLRNLAAQQEIYYSGSGFMYSDNVTALNVVESPDVDITIEGVTNRGWRATATHTGLRSTQTCGIYFGTPSTDPPSYVDAQGVVKCTNE